MSIVVSFFVGLGIGLAVSIVVAHILAEYEHRKWCALADRAAQWMQKAMARIEELEAEQEQPR